MKDMSELGKRTSKDEAIVPAVFEMPDKAGIN